MLIAIAAITVFMGMQWQHMRFTYTEANLLPDDHEINVEYQGFLEQFGEEGNLIVLGVKDTAIFSPGVFDAWNTLNLKIEAFEEVDLTLSVGNLQKLQKEKKAERFELVPFIQDSLLNQEKLDRYAYELYHKLPFYDGLIYSPSKESIRSAVYLDKEIVNTAARRDFIIEELIPLIEEAVDAVR